MSETCPTVKVKPSSPDQGAYVVINAADFDPAVHEPLDEEQADLLGIKHAEREDDHEAGAMKVADIRAALQAKGVEFDPKAKKPELLALLNG